MKHPKNENGPLSRTVSFCLNQSAPGGIRTPNLLIRSQMLYPLSYGRSRTAMIPASGDQAGRQTTCSRAAPRIGPPPGRPRRPMSGPGRRAVAPAPAD
jgi:hypothetical protein